MRAAAGPLLGGGAARAAGRSARRAAARRGRRAARGLEERPPRRFARSSSRWSPRIRACWRSRRSCSTARSATCCPRDSPRAPPSGRCARSWRSARRSSLARAGFTGEPGEAGDALFDALLASKSAVVFSVDEWEESFARVHTPNRRHPTRDSRALRELDAPRERARARREPRVPVRALRRRAALVHGQHDHPQPRLAPEGPRGRAAHPPRRREARRVSTTAGACASRRGAAARRSAIEISDRMQPGHVSLPNGLGLDFPDASGRSVATGVAPNELTRSEDRDWFAGTPWHKHTPARLEAL